MTARATLYTHLASSHRSVKAAICRSSALLGLMLTSTFAMQASSEPHRVANQQGAGLLLGA